MEKKIEFLTFQKLDKRLLMKMIRNKKVSEKGLEAKIKTKKNLLKLKTSKM